MNQNELKQAWLAEEAVAHIHGWDFSHIEGRYTEANDLPWDYRSIILQHLKPEMKLLDMDTGGGEFLLSLNHPHANTAASEAFPPNVQLCKETLLPLGVDFHEASAGGPLPFANESFDIVLNRHGNFNPQEIARVLKPGGMFITQQVGARNDRDLVTLLQPHLEDEPFSEQWLNVASRKFTAAGFDILHGDEYFGPIRFYDVGALVWFARIIQWEFVDFSVETCFDRLLHVQKLLEENGSIDGTIHRFILVARKKQA